LRFGLHDGYWDPSALSSSCNRMSAPPLPPRATASSAPSSAPSSVLPFLSSARLLELRPRGLSRHRRQWLLGMRDSARLACVTITIILLVPSSASRWNLALDRVLEVLFGIVIALAVTTLVLPTARASGCATAWLRNSSCSAHSSRPSSRGFAARPHKICPRCAKPAGPAARQQSAPRGGAQRASSPGWREGLSLLTLSGRSLYNALLALELAVKDSHEDRFAQQLEPVLTRLADDIHSGFNSSPLHSPLAASASRRGINLEQDIADLEARMDRSATRRRFLPGRNHARLRGCNCISSQIARCCARPHRTSHAVGQGSKEIESDLNNALRAPSFCVFAKGRDAC